MRHSLQLLVISSLLAGACVEPVHPQTRSIRSMAGRGGPELEAAAELEADDSEDGRLIASGAPELIGAMEAYRAGNAQSALSRFLEIVRDPLRPPLPRELAGLYAAKSMASLELHHAAWMGLDDIASRPGHPLRARALPWLAVLADHVGTDAVGESLAGFGPADVDGLSDQPSPIRERLAYLLGRRAFVAGEDAAALEILARVTDSSPDHPRTLYLRGAIHARGGRVAEALEAFGAVGPALARPGVAEGDRLADLAALARARVLFEMGEKDPHKLEEALAAYRAIGSTSASAAEAQLEAGWTLYRLERFQEALGDAEAVRSKLGDRDGEAVELIAAAMAALCRLDDAEAALDGGHKRLSEILAYIEPLRKNEPEENLEVALALLRGDHKPATPAERALAVAIHGGAAVRLFERMGAIERERERIAALPLEFTQSSAGQVVKGLLGRAAERTRMAAVAELGRQLDALPARINAELGRLEDVRAQLGPLRDQCK